MLPGALELDDEALPSRREGYTLDLDSTKLLHEDGHEEGVESGFTRQGIKPCLHPLLAVLAEARLVASFWLQAGNASCANNTVSFVHDLIANLPTHIRLFGVRADSGFCVPELLEFFESRRLRYVVVGRLHEKIQSLLRADCENVIKELQHGFGISGLICEKFHATEAALALAVVAYNLTVLFQRALGWQTKVTIHSLRYWIFITGGLISSPQGQTTIKIAVPEKERGWWKRPWEKILPPFPNCNAVENRPAFT